MATVTLHDNTSAEHDEIFGVLGAGRSEAAAEDALAAWAQESARQVEQLARVASDALDNARSALSARVLADACMIHARENGQEASEVHTDGDLDRAQELEANSRDRATLAALAVAIGEHRTAGLASVQAGSQTGRAIPFYERHLTAVDDACRQLDACRSLALRVTSAG